MMVMLGMMMVVVMVVVMMMVVMMVERQCRTCLATRGTSKIRGLDG